MAEENPINRGIGGNNPPEALPGVTARLMDDYAELLKRRDELIAGGGRVPAEITDDDTNRRAGDFVKQIAETIKKAESHRQAEKAPYIEAGGLVDAFFKAGIADKLKAIQENVRKRMTAYQRQAEEAERQRREEAARIAREAADRARKAAEEDARVARAAEEAARRERQEAEDARLAAEKAEREARAEAEASRQREEAERLARIKSEKDLAAAIEAEAAQKKIREKAEAERAAREAAEAERRRVEDLRREEEAREREEAARQSRLAAERAAEQAEADRVAAEKAAAAKASDMSRSRGDLGSVASLRTTWEHEVSNYREVDLNALRPYIKTEAIDLAIRAFIRSGGREIGGVRIFQNKNTQVR
jgi:hypothetical protein